MPHPRCKKRREQTIALLRRWLKVFGDEDGDDERIYGNNTRHDHGDQTLHDQIGSECTYTGNTNTGFSRSIGSAEGSKEHCRSNATHSDEGRKLGRKLRFGLIGVDDGLVHVHPPVERALKMTQAALEKNGHEVVPWSTEDHEAIIKNLQAAFFDFGGAAIMDIIKPYGEPVFPSMKGYAIAAAAGEGELGPTKMRMMNMRRNELQKAYLDRWNATATDGKLRLDGLICATSPWAAPRLGGTQKDSLYVGFTGFVNFLDFAACTFPVTFADKELDKATDLGSFKPSSDIDGRIQSDYDAEFYHGAPVALQIVGRRLEEEKVLEMCEVIADALKTAS